MTSDDVIHRYRMRLFALAAELGNVRAACRQMGVHHSTYYRWARQVQTFGIEALRPRERRAPRMPNQIPAHLEQRILAFCLAFPGSDPAGWPPSSRGSAGAACRSRPTASTRRSVATACPRAELVWAWSPALLSARSLTTLELVGGAPLDRSSGERDQPSSVPAYGSRKPLAAVLSPRSHRSPRLVIRGVESGVGLASPLWCVPRVHAGSPSKRDVRVSFERARVALLGPAVWPYCARL